jgi:hypothetical protein
MWSQTGVSPSCLAVVFFHRPRSSNGCKIKRCIASIQKHVLFDSEDPPARIKHLRLNLAGYVSTSIAIVVQKAA